MVMRCIWESSLHHALGILTAAAPLVVTPKLKVGACRDKRERAMRTVKLLSTKANTNRLEHATDVGRIEEKVWKTT